MSKQDKKLLNFLANEYTIQKLEDLKNANGLNSMSATIIIAIDTAHQKRFPGYVQVGKDRIAMKSRSPEEKATARLEEEMQKDELKKKVWYQKKKNICDALGGKEEEFNGQPHCRYSTYSGAAGGKVDVGTFLEPFETLQEISLQYQYRNLQGETGEKAKQELQEKLKTK